MAKSAKNEPAAPELESAKAGQVANDGVEPLVIALAEQLGTFLGRVQAKADGWLENETLRQQVGQIRDGAANLLEHVNRAGAAARDAVQKSAAVAKKAKATSAASAAKARSGGAVDAPGKRHRKPPPQESINRRMGESQGKQAGQKQFRAGKSRGRG